MATVVRESVVMVIDGVAQRVVVERSDSEQVKRFMKAQEIQRRMGVCLDSRHASTIGAGKHTGCYGRAMVAQESTVKCSNKNWRAMRRSIEAEKIIRAQR
jgi:hypothetical protein